MMVAPSRRYLPSGTYFVVEQAVSNRASVKRRVRQHPCDGLFFTKALSEQEECSGTLVLLCELYVAIIVLLDSIGK